MLLITTEEAIEFCISQGWDPARTDKFFEAVAILRQIAEGDNEKKNLDRAISRAKLKRRLFIIFGDQIKANESMQDVAKNGADVLAYWLLGHIMGGGRIEGLEIVAALVLFRDQRNSLITSFAM